MTKRPILLALVMLTLPLAGCADNGGDGGGDTTVTTPGTGTTTPPTATTPATGGDTGGETTTYVVGTDAAFPPFEDIAENGSFVGYDIDVMEEVARRNGWTIEWRNVGFDLLIEQVKNGQIDMAISAMTIRPDRAEEVDFSLPYFVAENQAVTKRVDDERQIASIEDLEGKRIGVQSGTTAQFYFDGNESVEVVRYDTYPLALQALRVGEVDAVVMDAPAQERAVAESNDIEIAFLFEVYEEYGIAVQKGRSELLNEINSALADMEDEGVIADLREKWGV